MSYEDELREAIEWHEIEQVNRGRSIMAGTYDFGPYELPSLAEAISDIDNGEKARKCIDDMGVLEAMLKKAGEYGQYSCQYLTLECQMYLRIAEALRNATDAESKDSFYVHLTRREQNMFGWIAGKTEDQRMVILSECSRGRSIWEQRKDETAVKNFLEKESEYNRVSSKIVARLNEDGRTNCSVESFFNSWTGSRKPDYRTVKAHVEKTRDTILRKGGVGLGDGKGTYVLPQNLTSYEMGEAVSTMVDSILADIIALRDLCARRNLHIPESAVKLLRTRINEVMDALSEQETVTAQ